MIKDDLDNIYKIALDTRKTHEIAFKGNFLGTCVTCSYNLYHMLKYHDYNSVLVDGEFIVDKSKNKNKEHTWIELDLVDDNDNELNNLIIDISADQFNKYLYKKNWFPPVFIGHSDRYISYPP